MIHLRRIAAIALACGVAFTPALASASTTPVTYTTSYAGYHAALSLTNGAGGYLLGTVRLPSFTQLSKVTSGVGAEIRLTSSMGTYDFQFSADPQTAKSYTVKWERGSTSHACQGTDANFGQGDVVTFEIDINDESEDYPGLGMTASDNSGNSVSCVAYVTYVWPGPSYSKIAIVDSFNTKGFHQPSSAVALPNWTNLDWEYGGGTTLASHSPGPYIATSTGTAKGTKRAVPSAIDSTGSGFTVSIP